MEKHYFTFGQSHTHRHSSGITLDCDSVVEIIGQDSAACRAKMFDTFGKTWAMQYSEDRLDLSYFSRGVVLTLTA